MWIETKINNKTKKTKYLFREKYIDRLTEKEKTVSVTLDKNTRETRSTAQKMLFAKISKLNLDENRTIVPITFGKLAEEWKEIYKKQIRTNTILAVNSNVDLLISIIGRDTIVHKINLVFLNKKFEELMFKEKGISTNYAKTLKTRLNLMFEFAIDHGNLKNNIVPKIKIHKKQKPAIAITEFYLEDDELNRLMDYLKNHNYRYYLLCQWLYLNGLRFGEGAAMQKTDVIINDERQYCKVDGTLEYHGKKISEQKKSNETKTASSMREVDLNSKAIEIYQEALKLSDSSFLFTTASGTPIQANALNAYFREHKEKMGFVPDRKISTHIFRHTHISKLAELGVPLHIIQRRAGHSSAKITEQIYLHVTNQMKSETKNLLEFL